MPTIKPLELGRDMIAKLQRAHAIATYLAEENPMNVETVMGQVESLRNAMTTAHNDVGALQANGFTGAQIANFTRNFLDPAPADLVNAYGASRTAVIAMLDEYGANVLPNLPFPKTWDGVNKIHTSVNVDLTTFPAFKTAAASARDALAPFA